MALSPALAQHQQLRVIQESLTAKEQTYVDARTAGTPPAAAARMAGYADPDTQSARMEESDRIRFAVEVHVKSMLRERQITRDDVINGLLEALNYCTTATEMINAWAKIGEFIGAKAPTEVNFNHTSDPKRMKELGDQQLMEMAGGNVIEGEYELVDFEEED